MKQHLISLKIYITMHWSKVDLNIRFKKFQKFNISSFQKQQNSSTVANNTKNRKKRLYSLTHHLVLMFQQILTKNSSAH